MKRRIDRDSRSHAPRGNGRFDALRRVASGDEILFPRLNLITSKKVVNGMQWSDLVKTRYHLASVKVRKSAGEGPNPGL